MGDNAINPTHYKPNPIYKQQPIEMMFHAMNRDCFVAYCQGCILKYLHRYHDKNGVEDLEKAKKYIDFIIAIEKGYDPLFAVNEVEH